MEYLCPYCCENIGTSVDLTDGSRSYIEDCQVCCQPIALKLQVDARGELLGLEAERAD
ncbi:MAG: CPXCG motif-containing cysteine-rich protein [Steroidobacteraceae bacterium]